MKIEFTKMQGIGNDYIYIDCMNNDVRLTSEQIAFLSDRRFGIGGDGVIFIRKSDKADGFIDMYNLDGSAGKMCGNGVRCVGKYLFDYGYAKGDTVSVETRSGIKTLRLTVAPDGKASGAAVDMGKAILDCKQIPVLYSGESESVPIIIEGREYRATCISMGNPHAVVFVDDPDKLELPSLGPLFENHPLFPDKVNTEFVSVLSRNHIKMRVWERGSGETLACGTGACASAVAAVLHGFCDYFADITVTLRGGELVINYNSDGSVIMTGAAKTVFSGVIEI